MSQTKCIKKSLKKFQDEANTSGKWGVKPLDFRPSLVNDVCWDKASNLVPRQPRLPQDVVSLMYLPWLLTPIETPNSPPFTLIQSQLGVYSDVVKIRLVSSKGLPVSPSGYTGCLTRDKSFYQNVIGIN